MTKAQRLLHWLADQLCLAQSYPCRQNYNILGAQRAGRHSP
jgi:hypothetical protein